MRRLLLFLLLINFLTSASAQEVQEDEILYICSYNADTYYSNAFTNDFTAEYIKLGGKCDVVIETMNCSNMDTHAQWLDAMNNILERHANPKLVILYGPEAWVCFLSQESDKWRKVPVCLIASQRYAACADFLDIPVIKRSTDNRKTVVDIMDLIKPFNVKMLYYYEYAVKEAMLVAQNLFPKVNSIAVIGDNSYSGYSMLKYSVEEIKKNFPQFSIKEIDGSCDDSQSALRQVAALKSNSAVLYTIWRYDKNGTVSLSSDYKLFEPIKDIPVLTLTGRGLGSWALGGCMPIYDWHDVRMLHPSLLAYEMIDQNIDIEPYIYRFPNYYQFDMNIVNRLGLDEAKLPEGTILINSKLTLEAFYNQYKTIVIVVVLLFVIVVVSLIVVLIYYFRIKRMKETLQESEKQLIADREILRQNERNLKMAKDRAEASDMAKAHFIHNISHGIRAPLNAIQGFSEIILDPKNQLDDESKRSLSFRIGQNVDAITDIVSNILEVSDIESFDFSIIKKGVMCLSLCEMSIKTASRYKRDEVEMRFSTDMESDFTLNTDAKLVREVLVQLLKNATKFTEKGYIELNCTAKDPDKVVFTVTDTGLGVPPDKIEYIFERYDKLDADLHSIGLGMNLCKTIAHKLGGDVTYDDSYKDGARFVFVVPKN